MIQLTLLIEVTGKVHYNNSDVIVHHYTLYIVSSLYKSETIASNMRQQGYNCDTIVKHCTLYPHCTKVIQLP